MVVNLLTSSMSEGKCFTSRLRAVVHQFLSLSSGATPETVKKAFEILTSDPKVKSIFINIFGGKLLRSRPVRYLSYAPEGIMRCDYIAEGVINAAKELNMNVPLVVRLKGTKEAEAKEYVVVFPRGEIFTEHFPTE